MDFAKSIIVWVGDNAIDIALVIVGLSALIVYHVQKKAELYSAGTLIIGQIGLVEKNISVLKNEQQLNHIAVYNINPIIKENMWEKYKHLFAKRLTGAEYEMVQCFFDYAEKLERARLDIVRTITNGWRDKSSVEHKIIADMICEKKPIGDMENFRIQFRPMELVFTPDVIINSLVQSLNNFSALTGTTAYSKIQRKSYSK